MLSIRIWFFLFLNSVTFLRSAYFQQIEEDVKSHAAAIMEMKTSITTFQTSDMSELIKFHKHVESQLEKLTDESQVNIHFNFFNYYSDPMHLSNPKNHFMTAVFTFSQCRCLQDLKIFQQKSWKL